MKRTLIFVIFLLSIANSGCLRGIASSMTFDNKRGWLPDDLEPKSTILLVEEDRWSKKQTQLMKDYMKKKYPYKYEFASYEAIHSKED